MFCPHCGKEVAEDQSFCHQCGARLQHEQPATPESGSPGEEQVPTATSTTAAGSRGKTPWEDRETRGFFNGLLGTLNEALFRPSEFFRNMPVSGGLTDPLLFALIMGMLGLMFSYFWQILMKGAVQNMMPGMEIQYLLGGIGLALVAFFSPFLVIIWLFVTAGILHVCLILVKGAKYGFEATFRVVSYGSSANVFLVIPFCGGLIAIVWSIVLSIIGLREAHETTGGKAGVAVFLPLIVCCGALIFLTAMFMTMAAVSFGTLFRQLQQ